MPFPSNTRRPFNPRDFQPWCWYKADPVGVTLQNGNVKEWLDLTGNGHKVMQSTTSRQPAFRTSGYLGSSLPYLDFNTDQQCYLQMAQLTLPQPIHVFARFAIGPAQNLGDVNWAWSGREISTPLVFGCGINYNGLHLVMLAPSAVSALYTFGTDCASEVQFNGASSKLRVNSGSYVAANAGTNAAHGLTFGRGQYQSAAAVTAPVFFREFVLFDRILSTAESDIMKGYITCG